MKRFVVLALVAVLAGCATIPGDPESPPLPFAAVADIPWQGAMIRPLGCSGEVGAMVVTSDLAYQILFLKDRAVIVDNRPGDELPVWFARIAEDKTFVLEFVLPYREAMARYPDPCDYLRPFSPAPATLRVEAWTTPGS